MGLIRTKITLGNAKHADVACVEVEASVDSASVHLSVPSTIADRLGLKGYDTRTVLTEDGPQSVPYVGPVLASFGDRRCYAGAVVYGNEVVLGSIPMDDMDLVVRPMTCEVAPNPLHPNIPGSIATGHRVPAR